MANSVATFNIKSAFQITGRQFFIAGDILSGTIRIGMTVDLSNVGIEKEFPIEAVEFVLYREGDKVWEDVALGLSDLTEIEKNLLKAQSPFLTPIVINDRDN